MGAILPMLSAYVTDHPWVVAAWLGGFLGLFLWLVWALKGHPIGFWFIFWGELAERASFYGMRTVLALYMTTVLGFEQKWGGTIMFAFSAACYLTPLFGGLLADRVLGRYRTILYFSGPYILGHIILGSFESKEGLFVALVLLALGAGSIKPNISTLMGDMYEKQGKTELLNKAFSYYYAAINVGSFLSTTSLPLIRNAIIDADLAKGVAKEAAVSHGYSVALMIPAVLMAVAFFAFAIGKKHYPVETPTAAVEKTPEQKRAERGVLVRISGILAVIALFWFVYDGSASIWIYFADNNMDMTVWPGFVTTPDSIQGLNPFLIVFFTPLFNIMWDFLKSRNGGKDVRDTRKMMAGFFIVVVCMLIMAAAGGPRLGRHQDLGVVDDRRHLRHHRLGALRERGGAGVCLQAGAAWDQERGDRGLLAVGLRGRHHWRHLQRRPVEQGPPRGLLRHPGRDHVRGHGGLLFHRQEVRERAQCGDAGGRGVTRPAGLALLVVGVGLGAAGPARADDFGPWDLPHQPALKESVGQARLAPPRGLSIPNIETTGFWVSFRFYQAVISPTDGPRCAHRPTCSMYAIQAMKKHPMLGAFMALDRLWRQGESSAIRLLPMIWGPEDQVFYRDPLEASDFWLP